MLTAEPSTCCRGLRKGWARSAAAAATGPPPLAAAGRWWSWEPRRCADAFLRCLRLLLTCVGASPLAVQAGSDNAGWDGSRRACCALASALDDRVQRLECRQGRCKAVQLLRLLTQAGSARRCSCTARRHPH